MTLSQVAGSGKIVAKLRRILDPFTKVGDLAKLDMKLYLKGQLNLEGRVLLRIYGLVRPFD